MTLHVLKKNFASFQAAFVTSQRSNEVRLNVERLFSLNLNTEALSAINRADYTVCRSFTT